MLYAADLEHGGLKDRMFVKLDRAEPPESLWWLSLNGISRAREGADDFAPPEKPPIADPAAVTPLDGECRFKTQVETRMAVFDFIEGRPSIGVNLKSTA